MLHQKIKLSMVKTSIKDKVLKKYYVTVQWEILRCEKAMIIIKSASLVQLYIRKRGSFSLREESSDQRHERDFFILGRLRKM